MTTPADSPPLLAGRYRLSALLGRGAFGSVHRAQDLSLGREVAVKLWEDGADDGDAAFSAEHRGRFLREARVLATLHHPHVVTVFDQGVHGEQPFIVMELVEGTDLATVQRERGPLPAAEVRQWAAQIASGLVHAHGLPTPVVHRDLKPANVLLAADGRTVKICDFSIASAPHAAATRWTRPDAVLGSLGYMSPELAAGRATGPATDLYALGMIVYSLLAGGSPVPSQAHPAAALAWIVAERPAPLRTIRPGVPADLADLVERLLAKDPATRPDAVETLALLQRSAGDDRNAGDDGDPWQELELAEAELVLGRADAARLRFGELADRLAGQQRQDQPAVLAAEFGKLRARAAQDGPAAVRERLAELGARAAHLLGAEHQLARTIAAYLL